ncbi:serine/threonine-protein kinase [Rhodococcus opacus]|uniref:serine/threonine-protein kinase n=1 Tax=Rhodococcus opacus TaxID=37919 RepID=UPI00294A14E6|nr:serine/threonine-protein kinase [Rhodococcus opacus]MDV6242209.1 serine/threonine-protein kinase [Rhodococcus opacus]
MNDRPPSDSTVASGPPTELGQDTQLPSTTTSGAESVFVVESGVERLVADWESSGSPAELTEYLPDTAAIRRAALIELIKVDLEYRWLRSGSPKRIADYCLEFPELLAEPLPPELVYLEYRVRRQSGADVDPAEYVAEYPQQAARFETLLEHDRRMDRRTITAELGPGDDLDVGERLDDFDLMMELGHGAFARVFLARQRSMQRWVALKISRNIGNEPQTLAQLDHPYIVRVYDQRVLEDRRLRVLFMEYVPGGTLLDVVRLVRKTPPEQRSGQLLLDSVDRILEERGEIRPEYSSVRDEIAALSWPETVAWIGLRLADALDYARAHGVLHRDIKPANVLLGLEGIPKLADFNVSSSDSVENRGAGGFIGGSVAYMSPEQLEVIDPSTHRTASDLDTRSDIFALGVMLWEMLTGARPFPDDDGTTSPPTPQALLESRRRGVDPERSALPEDCPAALRRILVKSLAPDRDDRWSSGRKLTRQFALCLDPHARDLVDPAPGSLRSTMWRWALPIVIAAVGIPNLLAAGYNYYYNKVLIIATLPVEAQQDLEFVHLVIGGIAFPLGAVLIVYWCRLALTVPRGLRNGRTYSSEVLEKARATTLGLGHRAVVVSFGLWVVAGVAYPVALEITAGGISLGAYTQLLASLAVCGAVALAYPFFILTFYAVRCLYPILLSHGELRGSDGRNIRALGRGMPRYLAVAAAVPLIGVAGLSFVGGNTGDAVNATVRALCLGGIFAFIAVYQLFRRIESDLRALERVVWLEVPGRRPGGGGRSAKRRPLTLPGRGPTAPWAH